MLLSLVLLLFFSNHVIYFVQTIEECAKGISLSKDFPPLSLAPPFGRQTRSHLILQRMSAVHSSNSFEGHV